MLNCRVWQCGYYVCHGPTARRRFSLALHTPCMIAGPDGVKHVVPAVGCRDGHSRHQMVDRQTLSSGPSATQTLCDSRGSLDGHARSRCPLPFVMPDQHPLRSGPVLERPRRHSAISICCSALHHSPPRSCTARPGTAHRWREPGLQWPSTLSLRRPRIARSDVSV